MFGKTLDKAAKEVVVQMMFVEWRLGLIEYLFQSAWAALPTFLALETKIKRKIFEVEELRKGSEVM